MYLAGVARGSLSVPAVTVLGVPSAIGGVGSSNGGGQTAES